MNPWLPRLRRIQEGALLTVLVLLPFSKAMIEIGFAVLLVAWLLEQAVAEVRWPMSWWPQPALRWTVLTMAAFLAAAALSIAWSTHPGLSASAWRDKWLEYLCYAVIAADIARRPGLLPRLAAAATLGAGLVAVDALWQEGFGIGLLSRHSTGFGATFNRMIGPYENPIDLATYFMVLLPVVAAQALQAQGVWRFALGGLGVILMAGMWRTEATGTWMGLMAGLVTLALLDRRLVRPLALLGVVLLAGGGAWLWSQGRLASALSPTDFGTQDRWFMWQAALGMIRMQPWIGVGLNAFMANYLHYWVGGEQAPRYAHNCYLQMAAEIGLPGLLMFAALLGTLVVAWSVALRRESRQAGGFLLSGLVAGLVAFLAHAAIDTNFYAMRQAALFWIFAGLALGYSTRVSARPAPLVMAPAPASAPVAWAGHG